MIFLTVSKKWLNLIRIADLKFGIKQLIIYRQYLRSGLMNLFAQWVNQIPICREGSRKKLTFFSVLPTQVDLFARLSQQKNDVCLRQMMLAPPMMTASPNDAWLRHIFGQTSHHCDQREQHHICEANASYRRRRCIIEIY